MQYAFLNVLPDLYIIVGSIIMFRRRVRNYNLILRASRMGIKENVKNPAYCIVQMCRAYPVNT